MHDINGKALHIGDTIFTYAYGTVMIRDILSEHDYDTGGATIDCVGIAKGGDSVKIKTHRDKVVKIRSWKELAALASCLALLAVVVPQVDRRGAQQREQLRHQQAADDGHTQFFE